MSNFFDHLLYCIATKFVTHGRCDARPTVTFPAIQHCHCCTMAGTVKLSGYSTGNLTVAFSK